MVFVFVDQLAVFAAGLRRIDDDVFFEVENTFELIDGQVEQQAHATGNAAVVPDVRDGARQFYVAHAFATNFAVRDFDAATVADDAFVPNRFKFTAVALPVFGRTEDPFAEQAVALRTQGPVVDGLGFFDFAVRPLTNAIRRCQLDANCFEVGVDFVRHRFIFLFYARKPG